MSSPYDPLIPDRHAASADDLDRVQDLFAVAAEPFLASPWSWLAWGFILPAAALATGPALELFGAGGGLGLWSLAILLGGGIEVAAIRHRGVRSRNLLAGWALRVQGNLSLVAVALSLLLLWLGRPEALPGIWLLLLGHSFFSLGGLAFPPLRRSGLVYQLGGLVALWPHGFGLEIFALATAVANLWMAFEVWRERRPASG